MKKESQNPPVRPSLGPSSPGRRLFFLWQKWYDEMANERAINVRNRYEQNQFIAVVEV